MKCRHCQIRVACQARGLCQNCYNNPRIRSLYPAIQPRFVEGDVEVKPERKPGDKYYRCLWCQHFLCDRPLRKCGGCQRKYDEAAADMPADIGERNRP